MRKSDSYKVDQHREKAAAEAEPDNDAGFFEAIYFGKDITEDIGDREEDHGSRQGNAARDGPHLAGDQIRKQQAGNVNDRDDHE